MRRLSWLLPMALLASCAAGPSARPAIVVNDGDQVPPATTASGPRPLPPLDEPKNSLMRWVPCGPEITDRLAKLAPPAALKIDCGRVSGVLDSPYAPGRGNMRMQVLRVGTGPVPLVVVNDVDGLPGTLYAVRLAMSLPADFLNQYSLVGLDRRGTGNSDAVRCVPEEVRAKLVDLDPRSGDVEPLVDLARTAGQQCTLTLESRLPAIDTWRTAADIESTRVALGMAHLHAIGHGEGSRVLSVFAERFPDKVGRMVLDGLPDPNEDPVVAMVGVAEGADAAFSAFAEDCARRACELGANARQALSEVLALPDFPLAPGVVLRAVLAALHDRQSWPALSKAIADARGGDTDGLAAFANPVVQETDELPATYDGTLVTRCNDTRGRLSTAQLSATAKDWNTRYPVFGGLIAQWLAVCSPWPVASHPVTQPQAASAPPMVVLSTATDAVTPHSGTERAAQQLTSAVLVSWQGAGHGAFGVSACATEAVTAFFTGGTLPRNGTVCPP
ncbi:probable exported protease [Alloactinosynnema sp. L-07]|uniref:alpha/beta hydrolase n=1 Tax=Alloactinosynnema sp. L-07 TaxID=1653480 RepID=UPI00065EFDE7|nr:alpha/beta hydrolase [Alloactinosynnema sp. L-07]CRK55902.1 probable exported protease [Alloactinosynnema sp. L-07]